ncbi:unnamed protein product [Rhizophagus irregularis]|nr:unnamed protein product [Rhizophagus irregularis]
MTKKKCCLETLDYYYVKPNRKAVPTRMQNHLDKECLEAPDNIENFVDCMSEEEQDNLKFQLAQALFSAEVPFAFVENLLVIQFFKCLWPSFKLPNRRKLARNLLNDVYDEVKLQTNEQISKAKTLCIVSDAAAKLKTYSSCFQSLQKSKTALEQTLIMDPDIRKKINNTVRNFVLSENFWDMLDTIIKFLEPIVIALKLFESDTSTFSTVYFHSKKLMHQVSEISCNFSNNIQQLVQKRWDYIYHPVMMAAYMLNSCFLEKSKNTDIEAMGYREFTEFTSKRFGQEESVIMFTELVKFRQKNLPYENDLVIIN